MTAPTPTTIGLKDQRGRLYLQYSDGSVRRVVETADGLVRVRKMSKKERRAVRRRRQSV